MVTHARASSRAHPLESRYLTSADGTQIAYHTSGRGPAMVLAGGLATTPSALAHQRAYFRDRFEVLSWDYRGMRGSAIPADRSALCIADHARDATAVLDAVSAGAAVWVGWGTGAQVGLEIAARTPGRIAAIVLIAPGVGRWGALGPIARRALRAVPSALDAFGTLAGSANELARRVTARSDALPWLIRLGLVGETVDAALFLAMSRDVASVDADVIARSAACARDHDVRAILGQVRAPVLVIAPEHDRIALAPRAIELARALPDAELLVVEGATHYVPLEYPELVSLRVEKFLRDRGLLPRREAA